MRTDDIVVELVCALAEAEGVPPGELPYNLTDHIDPVAVRTFATNGSADEHLSFRVADHRVTVLGSGDILVDGYDLHPSRLAVHDLRPPLLHEPMSLLTPGEDVQIEGTYFDRSAVFPDLCFVLDERGVYRDLLTKPGSSELLYRRPEELLENSIHDVLPTAEAQTIGDAIAHTLDANQQQTYSYELPLQIGTREFAARSHPIPGRDDRCVLLTVSDVTEERPTASRLTN